MTGRRLGASVGPLSNLKLATTPRLEPRHARTGGRDEHPVLALQRKIGNRRVTRLLQRRPRPGSHPSTIRYREGFTDRIDSAYGAGTLSAADWRAHVAAAREALKHRDEATAAAEYKLLCADVAKVAQADRILTGGGVNLVRFKPEEHKGVAPGMNVSLANSGAGGEMAATGWVNAAGESAQRLAFTADAPQLETAIVMYTSVFMDDKAATLAVLRHEMMHAEHQQQAADAIQTWLASTKGRGDPRLDARGRFAVWLDEQQRSGRMSALDASLIGESSRASTKARGATEVLAHVEGFMTFFHLEDPAAVADPGHAVWTELLGALEQNAVAQWAGSDQSVRNEALGRLQEYYCNALDRAHREVFDAWVRRETSVVAADRAIAGKAAPGEVDDEALDRISSGRAEAERKGHEVNMLADFVDGLREIVRGGCRALRPSMRLPSAPQRQAHPVRKP